MKKFWKRSLGVILSCLIMLGAMYLPVKAEVKAAYVKCPVCGADATYEKGTANETVSTPCTHHKYGSDVTVITNRFTELECTDISCGYYESSIYEISRVEYCNGYDD